MKRYALVRGNNITTEKVAAYLSQGYSVLGIVQVCPYQGSQKTEPAIVLVGEDYYGWTLDSYIIPRLGSGLMAVEEIYTDHPALAQLCPHNPNDGSTYYCKSPSCPIHGERNRDPFWQI